MTETRTPYTVGDPGDETTPRFGYTAEEVEEVAPGEYAPKVPQCDCAICRGRNNVAMAPTAEEMAAAIRRCAELRPLYLQSYEDYHQWRLALDAIDALAARLPKGR